MWVVVVVVAMEMVGEPDMGGEGEGAGKVKGSWIESLKDTVKDEGGLSDMATATKTERKRQQIPIPFKKIPSIFSFSHNSTPPAPTPT